MVGAAATTVWFYKYRGVLQVMLTLMAMTITMLMMFIPLPPIPLGLGPLSRVTGPYLHGCAVWMAIVLSCGRVHYN